MLFSVFVFCSFSKFSLAYLTEANTTAVRLALDKNYVTSHLNSVGFSFSISDAVIVPYVLPSWIYSTSLECANLTNVLDGCSLPSHCLFPDVFVTSNPDLQLCYGFVKLNISQYSKHFRNRISGFSNAHMQASVADGFHILINNDRDRFIMFPSRILRADMAFEMFSDTIGLLESTIINYFTEFAILWTVPLSLNQHINYKCIKSGTTGAIGRNYFFRSKATCGILYVNNAKNDFVCYSGTVRGIVSDCPYEPVGLTTEIGYFVIRKHVV